MLIKNRLLTLATDQEGLDYIPATQTEKLCLTRGKDTIHVLRLATNLHLLNFYLGKKLKPELYRILSTDINVDHIQSAIYLYNSITQVKSIFMHVAK